MSIRERRDGVAGDPADGIVSREIFSSETLFAKELERVFAPSWAFVGHTSQLAADGDFVLSRVGQESVIVTRERGGAINVLLNSCRHRGMPVCRYDDGNASVFTCSYHGWSYDLGGGLTGVPKLNEGYRGGLDRSQWGLIRARTEVFYGSIWATFDPGAPSLEEYLGDMALYLRDLLQGPDGEDDGYEVIGGIVKWKMASNWKFGAENFSGDHSHYPTHLSVNRLNISLSGKAERHPFAAVKAPFTFLNVAHPGGHTVRVNLYEKLSPYESMWAAVPEVDDYYRKCHEARQKRLGDRARLFSRGGIVFPNMHYNTGGRTTIGVWIPVSAHETEVWRWLFVPRNAPQIVKDTLRHFYMRYAGPSGMTEQDDMENWTASQRGTSGVWSRRYPFNYQLSPADAHRAWPEPWLGADAMVVAGVSEHNQRAFYTRWNELMSA
ncbi:MAG: Rieske 2Fe-2S domain-containing protein [Candidatus Lustribacter sp.]|jgi:phenylpropionate dioxygenase-like ring-hydroxylating dioxygenase large terminal subunit